MQNQKKLETLPAGIQLRYMMGQMVGLIIIRHNWESKDKDSLDILCNNEE